MTLPLVPHPTTIVDIFQPGWRQYRPPSAESFPAGMIWLAGLCAVACAAAVTFTTPWAFVWVFLAQFVPLFIRACIRSRRESKRFEAMLLNFSEAERNRAY